MNLLQSSRRLSIVFVSLLSVGIFSAAPVRSGSSSGYKNEIPEVMPQRKKAKIKKPVSAEKAQKQAEAKDKQRRKESAKYIEENRKRSLEIQTPEVRERMKQNVKDANASYKVKKKNNASRTKKAGRKYR